MNEIKILTEALERANKSGCFSLKESSLVFSSLEKVAEELINSREESVEKVVELKTED